jgi:hypothetical protein
MIAFLSEARFEGLPAILEGPGRSGKEIEPVDVAWACDLRELFERYPGDMEFVLIMETRTGVRRLKFGDGYKVKGGDAGFKAELNSLLPAMAVSAAA